MKRLKLILLIAGALIVLIGSGAGAYFALRTQVAHYSYVNAEKRTVREEVHASGVIKPAQSVDLSFERSGRIASVNVKIGDVVKAGDLLVQLDNGSEGAAVAQARAMLQQKQAGATPANIAMAQAGADAAKADLEKTKADTAALVSAAQAGLETAQNNLKLAAGGDESQIVSQAYENAVATLQATLSKLDDAMTQSDMVLGVDNISANINYQGVLSIQDPSKLLTAKSAYQQAKPIVAAAHDAAAGLTVQSLHADVDAAIPKEETAITTVNQLLSDVSEVLNATISGSVLPQADLAAKKSAVQLARTGVSSQYTAVIAAKQGIDNAKISLNTYSIAYEKAKRDLANTQSSTVSLVKLKESAYAQAQANLQNISQPPRSVDLAPLQASLGAAGVAYEKTLLRAPIAGVVSRMDAKVGGMAMPSVPLVSVIDERAYQVDLVVPETDVQKMHVGDVANVTIDAYGSDALFEATIVKIDPSATTVNGATGYIVTIQFTKQDDRIKAGMTANAQIVTQEKKDVVAVPDQSVMQRNSEFFVLVNGENGKPSETKVQVGIRSADGWDEITSGLNAGDSIINYGNEYAK
jgi:HlyD family secretion protein